ncbi:MAG: DNA polymerase III subunit gamma/tau [Aeromonas sp.]
MSYQVLARKWRPQRFEQVVGQQHVLQALTNALDQGRLHHAYLLSGTRGVGKTTIARILAKSLNCEQGTSSHPCGTCATCQEIDQGNYVDLLEIDAASRTKVEDTRELLDNVQYRPARGRFKVYLIDEVHMLSRHSFNALLKTLEEPPSYVKFLLATTDPQKLPITILSRCLQFQLKSLDLPTIAKQLTWVLTQEQQAFEASALELLAKAADGSMRDALSLTDQALAHGNGQVLTHSVQLMLGTLDQQHLFQLLALIAQQDSVAMLDKIAEISLLGPDFDQLHCELERALHLVAMAQLLPSSVQEQNSEAATVQTLAAAMSAEEVQLCYQIVLAGRKDLPWAPDGRTGLEMTCLRMLAFSPRKVPLASAGFSAATYMPAPTATGSALPGKLAAASVAPSANAPLPTAIPVPRAFVAISTAPSPPPNEDLAAARGMLEQEQTTLLEQAAQMGYGAALAPSMPATPTPVSAPVEDAPGLANMQSLLGKRNVLRSRLRGNDALATVPAAIPVQAAPKPVAVKPNPRSAASNLMPAPSSAASNVLSDDEAAYADYQNYADYAAYAADEPTSSMPPSAAPQNLAPQEGENTTSRSALAANTLPWVDEPVADYDFTQAPTLSAPLAGSRSALTPMPAESAVLAPASASASSEELAFVGITWDESPARVIHLEGVTPLQPASLLVGCGDAWAEEIVTSELTGRLRQLALNCVRQDTPEGRRLILKAAHRHLLTSKAQEELERILSVAGGDQRPLMIDCAELLPQETPLEIEQRLYHQVQAQALRDFSADEAVIYLQQHFDAQMEHNTLTLLAQT